MIAQAKMLVTVAAGLALVLSTTWLASRWRLEGDNYAKKKETDGKLSRNAQVVRAKSDAGILLSSYVSEGDMVRSVEVAKGDQEGKVIESKAQTERVKLNNASTVATAEAMRAVYDKAQPGPISPSFSEPSPFEALRKRKKK